jgi:hypothetical protein
MVEFVFRDPSETLRDQSMQFQLAQLILGERYC